MLLLHRLKITRLPEPREMLIPPKLIRRAVATCMCAGLAAATAAQQPPAAPPSVGGVIRGQVTDATTGLPLRQVRVELQATPRPLQGSWRTRTDADGRYRFEGLPPAKYTIAFSKARYVSRQFGQRASTGSGRSIDLKAEGVAIADLTLARAAAIVGHVVDDFGEPVENAIVRIVRPGFVNGRRRFVPATTGYSVTNDAGEYRIAGLAPGDYYVAVGERGDGFGSDAEADVGFAQTMFPTATTAAQARAVTVRAGLDATGIDIAIAPGRTATLSGLVTGADGQPVPNVMIQLAAVDEVLGGIGGSTTTQSDGTFSFPRVLSGAYEIHARRAARPSGEPMEGAIVTVTLSGADVVNLPVPLSRGAHITGRVIVPEERYSLLHRDVISTVVVSDTFAFGLPSPRTTADDGSFDWSGVIGPRLITAATLPAFWRLASVTRGADEITDTPTVFKDGDVVTITIAEDAGTIAGQVTTDAGRPVDDGVVVLCPDDASKWMPRSRYIRTAVPDADGTVTFSTLPPGRYLLTAVTSVEPGQEFDRGLLERLRGVATLVDLQPRAHASVVLKLVNP